MVSNVSNSLLPSIASLVTHVNNSIYQKSSDLPYMEPFYIFYHSTKFQVPNLTLKKPTIQFLQD